MTRGNPVKARRNELGMSQQTLAHEAAVSLKTVQNVEAGLDVRLSTLLAMARALDTTLEAIAYEPSEAA